MLWVHPINMLAKNASNGNYHKSIRTFMELVLLNRKYKLKYNLNVLRSLFYFCMLLFRRAALT